MRWTTTVDLAHVVMLVDQKLLAEPDAACLLRHIVRLRDEEFRPLVDAPAPRGLYLAYEDHLMGALGADVGGRLHTGRSRNDLKATVTALRLRGAVMDLVAELVRLHAVLLGRARAHRHVVMPVHTHHQAALPITYGYYLLGVALALSRDIAAIRQASDGLKRCPMGAGAAAGSDLPIDAARTAALLGFSGPPLHALDAVASRDVPLRILAAASGAALTLSRLATDLQLWSTAEFGFVAFPDGLVGGSSAMPQKRNAFLLEHLRAKAGVVVGAWTAVATITRATPFTNSIEVGTEAMSAVWPGLRAVVEAVLLAKLLVAGARPVPEQMLRRAEEGFVSATALANRLVGQGVPFRTAHGLVGDAVRRAVDDGATGAGGLDIPQLDLPIPSLSELAAEQRAGGGPGAFDDAFAAAHGELKGHSAWRRDLQARSTSAAHELAESVLRITASEPNGHGPR